MHMRVLQVARSPAAKVIKVRRSPEASRRAPLAPAEQRATLPAAAKPAARPAPPSDFGEHLKRNLSLASLRVTISTEQRKQLESAMRTWGRASRLRARRELKAMWLLETSTAFHRWLLLRRGVMAWCDLMNAAHRQRQRLAGAPHEDVDLRPARARSMMARQPAWSMKERARGDGGEPRRELSAGQRVRVVYECDCSLAGTRSSVLSAAPSELV